MVTETTPVPGLKVVVFVPPLPALPVSVSLAA
jgi:hypothetical protein